MSIKHEFQSGRPDNNDAGAIQPSHWDAPHVLDGFLALLDGVTPQPNTIFSINGDGVPFLIPTSQVVTASYVTSAIGSAIAALPAVAQSGSYSDLGNRPTLGSAAAKNVGTSAGQVVMLDVTTGRLPAVDGRDLTNLPATAPTIATQAEARAGSENTKTMSALRVSQAIAIRAPRGHIYGLNTSNNVSTPNTVLDIAAGEASSQNGLLMVSAAFSKNCNAAWAVGSANGALDSGSSLAASTWYHVFQIMRTDTYVVDFLISTSATAPTLPTSYTEVSNIGAFRTNASSQIIAFKQFGDDFFWQARVVDRNATLTDNTETLLTLTVPTGLRVQPSFSVGYGNSDAGSSTGIRVDSPGLGVTASLSDLSAGAQFEDWQSNVNRTSYTPSPYWTNTSGQLSFRSLGSVTVFSVITKGWRHPRNRVF